MGKINTHTKVKLIVGLIFAEDVTLAKVKEILSRKFGKIDFESKYMPFTHTDYYEKEFGKGLLRNFLSFSKLIQPESLPEIKQYTNRLEEKFSSGGKRQINIDPGYLDLAKLVLASTKDYRHRIYLNKGIYAEVTLLYQDNSFRPWEWTYPDYKTEEYIKIFNQIRNICDEQIKCAR